MQPKKNRMGLKARGNHSQTTKACELQVIGRRRAKTSQGSVCGKRLEAIGNSAQLPQSLAGDPGERAALVEVGAAVFFPGKENLEHARSFKLQTRAGK